MAFPLLRRYRAFKRNAVAEFYMHISDLLEHEEVQKLDNFIQHHCVSRLKHCLDVAYISFIIAKLFGWDARSTARGGLLHDLFHYDWHSYEGKNHASEHPKTAAAAAKKITALNKVEEDIILKHMWLVTLTPPRYKEGFIVTFIDKYCAIREFFQGRLSGKAVIVKQPKVTELPAVAISAAELPAA